ncbi:C-terminal binding protein [Streptomyces sp. DSM 41527]|uniref:PhpE n=2 Tax=Streptomyces TaxID=1883 RepID=A0A0M3WPE8_STRHY|nr:C-terminal binding protein [Streptomyces sp. DSM 41527]AKN91116.1 PhpE [Streptomyces hygroscopicus]MDT0457036.1 C-terminal binding protein [Streptomyces sp. DSM 41527]
MRVVYTDPAWALDADGRPDPALAAVERSVLGPDIDIELGCFEDSFVTSGDRFHQHVRGADALVIYRCQVTPELLGAVSPGCKVIARSGVGVDNLNAPLLADSGIIGFNVPDYCGDEVSTHTLALLLALERGVSVQDRLVRADRWGIHRGGIPRRTCERTVGIVGFGRIGRATTRKLQPFYRQVLAVDPYVHADVMAGHGVTPVDTLEELLQRCDAVVLHTALTDETRNLISGSILEQAKPGAFLVNTARGALVDPGCVLRALESEQLGGFASDVFSPEDPNQSPVARKLLERDDVVVSSHRAFLSAESEESLRRRVAEGVRSVLRDGNPPAEGRVA